MLLVLGNKTLINEPFVLDGPTLRAGFLSFLSAWKSKLESQAQVTTFNDQVIDAQLRGLSASFDSLPWELDLVSIIDAMGAFIARSDAERLVACVVDHMRGRFIAYEARNSIETPSLDATGTGFLTEDQKRQSFAMSQGRFDSISWKGMTLFKTAYDLVIYQMLLWELKPKTIIEIGSGSGASAAWMSDLMDTYAGECQILSVDIRPPLVQCRNVTFLAGDCNRVSEALPAGRLRALPHPWVLIEDAHVNVGGVLRYFDDFTLPGDYLLVEDSLTKQSVLRTFMEERRGYYEVDTHYCDFFGRNVTCCHDSIFRRTDLSRRW
jgi:cephalosporin hydroxylase